MMTLHPAGATTPQNLIPNAGIIADLTPNFTDDNAYSAYNDGNNADADYTAPDLVAGELAYEFAMLDPSLAAFHGDLRIAAAELAIAKKSGKNIDIALYKFETAESMYQTRLFEVRKNKLSAAVTDNNDNAEAKSALHKLTMQQKMNDQFAALRKRRITQKRRQKEQNNGWFFYFMLGLWLAQMQQQRQHSFKNNMQSQMNATFTNNANTVISK